jgi:hypothetical protein
MNNKDAPMRTAVPAAAAADRDVCMFCLLHARGTGRLWWMVVDGGVDEMSTGTCTCNGDRIEGFSDQLRLSYHIVIKSYHIISIHRFLNQSI